MSLSNKEAPANDKKPSATGKAKSLNPDAAEFVPFALRSPSGSTGAADGSSSFGNFVTATPGKGVLDRSESYVSNNSDEEAHQFWRQQLPDDITPDFKVTGEDDSQGIDRLTFSSLSLTDVNETSSFPASTGSGFILKEQQELSPYRVNVSNFAEMRSYGENPSSAGFQQLHAKPWEKQIVHGDQLLTSVTEGHPYNGNSGHGYLSDMLNEQQMVEGTDVNPLGFLASQFPGFAAESLAEVYFANGGDLNLTIEMLTQLEDWML